MKQKNKKLDIEDELIEEEILLEEIFLKNTRVLQELEHDLEVEWDEVMGRFSSLEDAFEHLDDIKKSA
jgi:hypothetical protein